MELSVSIFLQTKKEEHRKNAKIVITF